jgi:hypothetical protein
MRNGTGEKYLVYTRGGKQKVRDNHLDLPGIFSFVDRGINGRVIVTVLLFLVDLRASRTLHGDRSSLFSGSSGITFT